MRGHLYRVIAIPPNDFIPCAIQKDILTYWLPEGHNLFSVSQIAERTKTKRGAVKRRINQLIKLGVVTVSF